MARKAIRREVCSRGSGRHSLARTSGDQRPVAGRVPAVGHEADLREDRDLCAAHRRAGRMCLGPGCPGGAEAVSGGTRSIRRRSTSCCSARRRPDYPLADDRLSDAGAAETAHVRSGRSTSISAVRVMSMGWPWRTGLIRTGSVQRVLLITAETYTKYIHPEDRSLRTIFGDGASATLIEAADRPSLFGFRYGTDGSRGGHAADDQRRGSRPDQAHQPRHRQRWESDLYMDGPALITFTVDAVPHLVSEVLDVRRIDARGHRLLSDASGHVQDDDVLVRSSGVSTSSGCRSCWRIAATPCRRRSRS